MAKQRFVNTRFWSDNFIVGLEPLERYLFLYFLTNEHTNICGIYELSKRTILFETGLTLKQFESGLGKLAGRIDYVDGWVWLRNFQRHNYARGHSKVIQGIKNSLKDVPSHILEQIEKLKSTKQKTDTPSEPIKGDCDLDSDSDSDSDSTLPSVKGAVRHGDPFVNWVITEMETVLGFTDWADSSATRRKYAHLVKTSRKWTEEQISVLLNAAKNHPYHSRWCKMSDLYFKGVELIREVKQKSEKSNIAVISL